jgi:hypothetical protein
VKRGETAKPPKGDEATTNWPFSDRRRHIANKIDTGALPCPPKGSKTLGVNSNDANAHCPNTTNQPPTSGKPPSRLFLVNLRSSPHVVSEPMELFYAKLLVDGAISNLLTVHQTLSKVREPSMRYVPFARSKYSQALVRVPIKCPDLLCRFTANVLGVKVPSGSASRLTLCTLSYVSRVK